MFKKKNSIKTKNSFFFKFFKKNFFKRKKTKKIDFLKEQEYFLFFFKKNFLKKNNFFLKKKSLYFLQMQLKNKLLPDIFFTKNFQKIKTVDCRLYLGNASIPEMQIFYFLNEILKTDFFIKINHRFIFKFFKFFF